MLLFPLLMDKGLSKKLLNLEGNGIEFVRFNREERCFEVRLGEYSVEEIKEKLGLEDTPFREEGNCEAYRVKGNGTIINFYTTGRRQQAL